MIVIAIVLEKNGNVTVDNAIIKLENELCKRLTDNRTAEALERIIKGLILAGREPALSDLRYLKLNHFEQIEQQTSDVVTTLLTEYVNIEGDSNADN